MNIQYILIALTCLMLSIDSAAMRGHAGGGMRAGAGRTLHTSPTAKPGFKSSGKQNWGHKNWDHKNQWQKPDYKPGYGYGHKTGYNPWHRPNYWHRPVYAPTYVGVGYSDYDYYPDYYSTGYTSGEQLGIYPQDQTNWSGY